jgi:capsular polysaccharide biosynthesis protein
MILATLSDLRNETGQIFRLSIAPAAGGYQPRHLIPGTEEFAFPWLRRWHQEPHNWPPYDVACYSVLDAVVSGAGNVWIADRLVTSPEVMPPYVADGLGVADGGNDRLKREHSLPIRSVARPCLVAVGHGIRVYGHFMIEMLFRILVARRAYGGLKFRSGVLLDKQAPSWLLDILTNDLGISTDDFEFFDSSIEQVRLKHAILPGRVFIGERVHPVANELLDEFLHNLTIPAFGRRRVFVTRRGFSNPAAPHRICTNEQELAEIARLDHGFEPIAPEEISWREQIALFRDAEIIVGQAGSGLHTALFASSGSRLASIGFMNLVQPQIASLRGQETAYFAEEVKLSGEFRVDKDAFRRFIGAVSA